MRVLTTWDSICFRPPVLHTVQEDSTKVETRRVAVYLKTHCNMGSKRVFPTSKLDRWYSCLLIYWRTTCYVPAFDDAYWHVLV